MDKSSRVLSIFYFVAPPSDKGDFIYMYVYVHTAPDKNLFELTPVVREYELGNKSIYNREPSVPGFVEGGFRFSTMINHL